MEKKPVTQNAAILWAALFEQPGDAMVVLRLDGSVYRANSQYSNMLGYTLDEMAALNIWDWDDRFSPDELLERLTAVEDTGALVEEQQRRKDGTYIDVELSKNGAWFEDQRLVFSIVRDITERKKTEEKLRQSEERLQQFSAQVPGALFQYRLAPDGTRSFPFFSEGIFELSGLTQGEMYEADTDSIMASINPEDAEVVEASIQKGAWSLTYAHKEFRIRHRDGSTRWIESRSTPQKEPDGSIVWTGVLLDITQRKRAEERIQVMAITDGLTGIANRLEFDRLLEQEIERAIRYQSPLSLIMYDLDDFKQVNDHFGHNAGDEELKTVVNLVNDNIRASDLHGRWGGEEFMVLLPQTGLDAAMDVAEKLRRSIAEHHFEEIGSVTASFGVAELAREETSRSFTQRVDEALYRAKGRGKNRVEASYPDS